MKLISADYMVVLTIIFLLGAHLITAYLISSYSTAAEKAGVAKSAVMEYEANPIARFMFSTERFRLMYTYIMMPALVAGIYYYIRTKYFEQMDVVTSFAIIFMMVGLCNFLNDLTILLGHLASVR